MPPGLLRSLERGAVTDDLPPSDPEAPARSALAQWAAKNLTVTNLLLAVVFLFQTGSAWARWSGQQADATEKLVGRIGALEIRLQAAETAASSESGYNANTYVRQDVINAVLKSMDQRLTNIEGLLRERERDRRGGPQQ